MINDNKAIPEHSCKYVGRRWKKQKKSQGNRKGKKGERGGHERKNNSTCKCSFRFLSLHIDASETDYDRMNWQRPLLH